MPIELINSGDRPVNIAGDNISDELRDLILDVNDAESDPLDSLPEETHNQLMDGLEEILDDLQNPQSDVIRLTVESQDDLKFSGEEPVVISYNGSEDDIYASLRTSSADINIVSGGILDDLYTAKKDEIYVKIERSKQEINYNDESLPTITVFYTIWEGYKMPNTYSQSVTPNLDEITMTMIDPLSILKYITVDKLFNTNTMYTFREVIGKAIGYIYINSNILKVEQNVSYGGAYDYNSNNGLLDLCIQMSNFWDEGGDPSTVYDVLREILKPFCMTLAFDGKSYIIYNSNKTTGVRLFDDYVVDRSGALTDHSISAESTVIFDFDNGDWKPQDSASIDINSTYDEVTATASTSKPEFSNSALDKVDYNQIKNYDYFDVNVQKNKTKGYCKRKPTDARAALDTKDYWYYLWNGVYTNNDYKLKSNQNLVNGYLNINKAYVYREGSPGNPTDYGSIINFYGGGDNPTATGKHQYTDKSVQINKKITAYAPDNGVPLEFLELTDLSWAFNANWVRHPDQDPPNEFNPAINKNNDSDSRFGEPKLMQDTNRIVYHQPCNMYINENNEYTLNLNLTQSYSRTGIDSQIDIMNSNTATNRNFLLEYDEDNHIYDPYILTFDSKFIPKLWQPESVTVNCTYFDRYRTNDTRISPVWDKRRIDMYIELSDHSFLQFNGKEWVTASGVSSSNCFYLKKLMNDEKLYHTEYKYNLIETADGNTYSLSDEDFVYYTNGKGGVTKSGTKHTFTKYFLEENEWYKWVNECNEGNLSIRFPSVRDSNAQVVIDVYNSTLLGSTGSNHNYPGPYDVSEPVYFEYSGPAIYWDPNAGEWQSTTLSQSNIGSLFGDISGVSTKVKFQPYNTTYVKGEHLDLNINISVPESNLGQMFSESDIKYKIIKNDEMVEKFDGLSFNVNTYNQLVNNSFSYILFDNGFADPNNFIINYINTRPEIYTIQAYMNWLSTVRKVYKRTILPKPTDFVFSNIRTFMTSPEVGSNRLMVIADAVDLKSNRHTITAIECQDMTVTAIDSVNVMEIPRKARNERWNLPTAIKK